MAIQGQNLAVPCTPDSLLFQGNDRIWLPGEPFQWADPQVYAELDSMDMEGFIYQVESPRKKGRFVSLKHLKSKAGQSAWYVDGDLRYITYDGLTNASQSTLLGHNVQSVPYWRDSTLFWQNGRANWFKHQHRLYHSAESKEIESFPTNPGPANTEDAVVMVLDSMSLFINQSSNPKEFQVNAPIHALAHTSHEWTPLGLLNPAVTALMPEANLFHIQDFAVSSSAGILWVCRKQDLMFAEMNSIWALKRSKHYQTTRERVANSWIAWKGNTLFYKTSEGIVKENIEKLVEGAEWKPLIVPAPEIAPPTFDLMQRENKGWLAAIALGMLSLFLGFSLLGRSRAGVQKMAPIVIPDGEGQAPLSAMVVQLLGQRGRLLSAAQFDAIVGLDQVHSPETRRSRRARIIQVANTETTARFGHPLVVRTKSETDKRIVLYRIQDLGNLD